MARTLGSDALLPEVNGRWPIVVLIFNLLLLGERVMGQACSIDLGADTTICQGQSVTLTAPPGYPDYLWSTGATTQSISVGSAGTFWGEASYTSPQLFVNSDFNAGATGFSTQFNQSTTLVTDGNYWIGTNAASYHPQFFGTGTGNFMIVNSGWPSALFNVYCQDVVECPEQTYTLRYRARTLSNDIPARLQWWINGTPVGPEVNLPAFNAGWQAITQTWTSGAGVTNASICLRVMSGDGIGNDFGLDDVTMQGTMRLRDEVNVSVTPLPVVDLGPNATLCNGQNLVLDAAVPGGTYLWQDGSTNPGFVVSGQGTYSVTVTANGCSATDAITVNYNALPTVNLGPDQTLCVGETVTLNAALPGATYVWQDGSVNSSYTVTGPGTYSVQVTRNNCPASDAVDIAYTPLPVVDLGADVDVCADIPVVLDATTPGGSYVWQDGSTGATFTPTTNGTYSVTVTVDDCSASDAVDVNFRPLPVVDLGPDQTVCPGTTVTLDVTTAGGSYVWQDGSTQPTFDATAEGLYTAAVTVNGCTTSDSFTLTHHTLQTVDLGPDVPICAGQATTIGAVVAGSTYTWSTGASTATIGVSTGGTYWVDVTLNGCVVRDSIDVMVTPLPVFDLGVDQTICPGMQVTLDATTAGATYTWNTGVQTATIDVGPGSYDVTVTANNCSLTDNITVSAWPAASVVLGADVTLCPGTQLVLDATQTGASYVWQDGSTNATYTVTTDGTYDVQLTDANGCIATDVIDVTYAAPTPIDLGADTTICQGTSITLDATTAGATYAWSTGESTPTITVAAGGNYDVVVTQGTCMVSDAIAVTVAALPTVALGNDVLLCPGEDVVLDATGPGLSYAWSSGAATPTITVTSGGTYSVNVTNAANCTATDAVDVSYASPGAVDLGADLVLCQGESATLDATLPGATYAWSTGAATPTISVNTSGTFAVTVAQGTCTITDQVDVLVNPMPQVDLGNDVTLCAGEDITLDATWPGASYDWSNGASSATITVTTSGTYSVDVDLNGCIVSDAITVTVLSATSVDLGPDQEICEGEQVVLDATTPGSSYVWNNGASTPTITVTTSGTYSVTVSTGLCSVNDQVDVLVNPMPQVDLGNDVTLCAGEDITLDATWPGASYAWSTGASSATITATTSGTYSVDVDLNGCIVSDAITVTVLSATSVDLGPDQEICEGEQVVLDATTPGASYLWSTGETSASITVMASETYSVTVSVAQCDVTDEVDVLVNPSPQIDLGADQIFCSGETVTTLDATWPGATYLWSTGATTGTIDVTSNGEYTVDVDLNGCTTSDAVTITFGSFSYDLGADTTLCPGGTLLLGTGLPSGIATWNDTELSNTFTVGTGGTYWLHFTSTSGCDVRDTIVVDYVDPGPFDLGPDQTLCEGEQLQLDATLNGATHLWEDGATDPVRTVSTTGTYSVEASIGECVLADAITITFDPLPTVDIGADVSLCPGTTTTFDATTANATYTWQNGTTGATFTASSAGLVTVEVTVNGCSSTDEAVVILLDGPDLALGSDTTICAGADLLLVVNEPGTTYAWDDGSQTDQRVVGSEGVYWVDATRNSCTLRDSIYVNVFSPDDLDIGADRMICAGSTTTLDATYPGANYLWNTGASSSTIVVSTAGMYSVTMEVSGCVAEDEVLIDVLTIRAPELGADRTICEGGSLELSIEPTAASILWSTGETSSTITVDEAGTYTVTIDSLGCTASDVVLVRTTPMTTQLDLGPDRELCSGVMDILGTPAIPGATFTWSTGAIGPWISIDAPGTYSVHATGQCIDARASIVVEPADCGTYVFVPNAFTPNGDDDNDMFLPSISGPLDQYRLDIFDRWGERIHTSTDRYAGWDGSYNGVVSQDGVYVWTLNYRVLGPEGVKSERLIGHVTLLR